MPESDLTKPPCTGGCLVHLADIEAAIVGMQHQLAELAASLNSIGALAENHATTLSSIMTTVGAMQERFTSVSPTQLISSFIGGKRGR